MQEGSAFLYLLVQGDAHQEIAGVGNDHHYHQLPQSRPCAVHGEADVLARRSVAGEAREKALECIESAVSGDDPQAERHSKITDADRYAGSQSHVEFSSFVFPRIVHDRSLLY